MYNCIDLYLFSIVSAVIIFLGLRSLFVRDPVVPPVDQNPEEDFHMDLRPRSSVRPPKSLHGFETYKITSRSNKRRDA